jgi:capsular polysaccharide biosynthesis protein
MEKEISLIDLSKALLKKAWLIMILAILGAIIAYSISAFLIAPSYTAMTSLYVKNKQNETNIITSAEVSTSKALVKSYIVILESETVMSEVAAELNALRLTPGYEFLNQESEYTANKIRSMQKADAIDETESFYIEVTASTPEEAQFIAQKLSDTLIPKIEHFTECKPGTVKPLDPANIPTAPSSPKNIKNAVIGAFLGIIIAALIVFITFITDKTVEDETSLSDAFEDIILLGTIPVITPTDPSFTKTSSGN